MEVILMLIYLIGGLYFFSIGYIIMFHLFMDPIRMGDWRLKIIHWRYVIHFICLILLIIYILYNGIIFSMLHIFLYIISAIAGCTLSYFIHCIHDCIFYLRIDIYRYVKVISTVIFICLICILLLLTIS